MSDSVDTFKEKIENLKVDDPATSRERSLLKLGGALLIVGAILLVFGVYWNYTEADPVVQRDAQIWAFAGIGFSVIGSALFIRFGVSNFLRFWLARLIYEQQDRDGKVAE